MASPATSCSSPSSSRLDASTSLASRTSPMVPG
jgi:hypothetical protein